VAWDEDTTHKCFGGLGIPNLCLLNLALCYRWAWIQWTYPTKAWAGFDLQLPHLSVALFDAAMVVQLGDGERARFWHDRWLDDAKVEDITLNVAALVPAHKAKVRTVKVGLSGTWLRDCGLDLGEATLREFFILCQVIIVIYLTPDQEDTLRWCWSEDRVYLAKSQLTTPFSLLGHDIPRSPRFGALGPPMVASSLCGSFLEHRGLPRPVTCPLCDQVPEMIQVARQV
jgi:hypothetical protein